MTETLYLIDGHAIAYRAYFALTAGQDTSRWMTPDGEPTAGTFGFASILTAFAAVPVDRFLFETDCPYLAPEPYRGEVCDSSMIAETARCGAEIKGIDAVRLTELAAENTERLFGIKLRDP